MARMGMPGQPGMNGPMRGAAVAVKAPAPPARSQQPTRQPPPPGMYAEGGKAKKGGKAATKKGAKPMPFQFGKGKAKGKC